jgi:phage replication-related protein YjqB (UPF0714/DUF867 family)
MNAVSQWWIGGLRTRKAKVAGSIPAGGSSSKIKTSIDCFNQVCADLSPITEKVNRVFTETVTQLWTITRQRQEFIARHEQDSMSKLRNFECLGKHYL